MNILFFLTPKAACAYLRADDTVRQALERMESAGYAALPILARDGSYCGTLTEGDLLWAIRNLCMTDLRDMENHGIMEISHRRDNQPVCVNTKIEDLMSKAVEQNFVPVVDDRNRFIGIITRKAIMQYCMDHVISGENRTARETEHKGAVPCVAAVQQ